MSKLSVGMAGDGKREDIGLKLTTAKKFAL